MLEDQESVLQTFLNMKDGMGVCVCGGGGGGRVEGEGEGKQGGEGRGVWECFFLHVCVGGWKEVEGRGGGENYAHLLSIFV